MDRGIFIFILLTNNADLMHLKKEQICQIVIFYCKNMESGGTMGHSSFFITFLKMIPVEKH